VNNNEEQPKSEVKSPEDRTPMDPRAKKMIVIVSIAAVVIVALLVIAGFFLYSQPQTTTFLRDIAVIILAFETLVVIFFLGVMTVLLIYVILTLEREIKPVLDATSETVYTVRGTTTFVSDTVVSPIIKVASTVGAIRGAAQAIAGLRPKGRGKQRSD
jgi:cytochrome b subunit of formate dehydrogenase